MVAVTDAHTNASKVMVGLAALGTAFDHKAPEFAKTIGQILGGMFKEEIKAACFHSSTGMYPAVQSDLEGERVTQEYERILRLLRGFVEQAVSQAVSSIHLRQVEREALAFQALRNQLAASSKPHPQGTVNEIAAKFGISKSEVRRRKQDGTLDALFATNPGQST
jgi:hypothetical protein